MKHLTLILLIAILSTLSFAAGKSGKVTLESRVATLEAAKLEADQAITVLVQRSEYLKYHLDQLEQSQRVNRASR